MKLRPLVFAVCLLAACSRTGAEEAPPEPAPEVAEPVSPEIAAPCRPAGEAPATLSIGPLDLGPDDFTVRIDPESDTGTPVLNFGFNQEAAEALGRVTTKLVGQAMPVKLDGETVMSPILREPILGGRMQLSGQFEFSELETLARRLSPPCQTTD